MAKKAQSAKNTRGGKSAKASGKAVGKSTKYVYAFGKKTDGNGTRPRCHLFARLRSVRDAAPGS